MSLPNIFNKSTAEQVVHRINQLNDASQAKWGKMSVSQMLAHCNVTYEMAYDNKHPKPNFVVSLLLKAFVKNTVVNNKPYKKSSQTAPAFIIHDNRNFETEKNRLINYINKTVELGENYFDHRQSLSFGKLSKNEWNNMFYKHLDHHLSQFGV